MDKQSFKTVRSIERGVLLFFAFLLSCGPSKPDFPSCTAESDCSGLIPCVAGKCIPECSEEEPCIESSEACVFGGCTGLPFEGPFFVRTGPDSSVDEGETVTLDGGDTIYVGTGTLAGQWLQVDGPAVDLVEEGLLVANFTAPGVLDVEALVFRLVVFDSSSTASAERTITVNDTINEPPIAKAKIDPGESVVEENTVTLDAGESYDPNPKDSISFTWTQIQGPIVVLADLGEGQPNQKVQFLAPQVNGNTDIIFRLRVEDGRGGSDEIEVDIRVRQLETVICTSVSECLTDAPCTTVECVAGLCLDSVLSWCCAGGRSCDDGDPCTEDTCDTETGCAHKFLAGCCHQNEDCPNPGGCWQGLCSTLDGACTVAWIPGCCESASECPLFNPCGQAVCHEGQCHTVPQTGCCIDDADCDDAQLCTADYCDPLARVCRYEPTFDCCEDDGDCLTPTLCLINTCDSDTNQCVHKPVEESCCVKDDDCDDGNQCSTDFCSQETGLCSYTPLEDCCQGHNVCPNAGPCTVGLCINQACALTDIPGCCDGTDELACSDDQACTDDICVTEAAQCINLLRPSCCSTNQDCDDANECTLDECDLVTGACLSIPIPECCASTSDCDDGNPCTSESCDDTQCVFQPVEGCCASNTVCDDGDPCTVDQCDPVTATCIPVDIDGCCNFDEDCSALSEPCRPAYCFVPNHECVTDPDPDCCAIDGNCAMAGPCVLRMCMEETCIASDLPFCCVNPGDCDDGNLCTQDLCDALTGSCVHQPVVNCCRRDADCPESDGCVVPLCNTATGTCELFANPDCCSSTLECDDGDPCTDDSCVVGQCQQIQREDCCNGPANCTPANACALPQCENFTCKAEGIPGCCLGDADCALSDPCKTAFCDARIHQCVVFVDPQCCTQGSECDDENPCTDDVCVSSSCINTLVEGTCCTDSDSCPASEFCTPSVCLSFSLTCEIAPMWGCCQEDMDCAVDNGCGPFYCSALQASCIDTGALCCATDAECETQTDCRVDVCIHGQCVSRINCCTTNTDCDDGNPCTADVCVQGGTCAFNASNPGQACNDGKSSTLGDFCDSEGYCQGFHAASPPLTMVDSRLRSFDPHLLLAVGETELGGSTQSLVVLNQLDAYPNQWDNIVEDPFVSVVGGYALSRNGAVWKLINASSLTPLKNQELTTVLSAIGVGDWAALALRRDPSGVAIELLAGGSSDILARCTRLDENDPWLCAGEDIGAFVGVNTMVRGWDGAPDYWLGSLGADGSMFLLGDTGSWTVAAPIGCGLSDAECAMDTLSALHSWPEVQLVLALGSPGAVLRWVPDDGWIAQGPPFGVVGPSLAQFEFRGAARDGDLVMTVGYEQLCALSVPLETCPLYSGRWWLWPALVESDTLTWLTPQLLYETNCGQALGSPCLEASEMGPSGLSRDILSSRWMLGGSEQKEAGTHQALLFWRP